MNRTKLRAQLIDHEGLRLKPYTDTTGHVTIGVGRNLDGRGISEAEAFALLDNDIERCEAELDANLPWWRKMSEVRQRVLLDMCFNLGITKLLEFKNTLRNMELRRYRVAAEGMLDSKWARQVGRRATNLAAMMRSGK